MKLLHLEQSNTSWKSFLYSLPKGVMSFVLRSFIDCLSSLAALERMNKRSTTRCFHCNNHETLHHILNCCSIYLNQGRYTWRHKAVRQYFVFALVSAFSSVNSLPQIYADLPGNICLVTLQFPHTSYQQPNGLILSYFSQTEKYT